MESMYGVGTMLGFFLSSLSLTLWVDFYRLGPDAILPSPEHPAWLGAWWLGLLSCGAFVFVCSFPVCCFPHQLPKSIARESSKENQSNEEKDGEESEQEIRMRQKSKI